MNYIFDLDLTLWDTFNKHNNPIWAKQMVWPMQYENDVVTDDVFSTCTLRKGVREYLSWLRDNGHTVGYVSAGRYWLFNDYMQPTIHLLEAFDINKYFNGTKILHYKTMDKADVIEHLNGKIVFYDDSPKVLQELKRLDNVIAVDSTHIRDWSTLIGKDYD